MKDGFGREIRYLRISVTELCNLRCRYCMPEEGVEKRCHEEMLTEEETVSAARAAVSLGVDKIRITGGEPLVKKNIISLCEKIGAIDGLRELCITTNGTLLPRLAEPLRKAGVKRVNLSLDTLDAEKYAYITRRGTLDLALKGLEAALEAGFDKVKINAVLIGGFNDDEVPALAELTRRYPVDVRFIELMPMEGNRDFGPDAFIPYTRVLEALPEAEPLGKEGGVAKLYRLPGALGSIGLISPLGDHFCGTCDRLRLLADGKLKPCLHAPAEYSIKGMTEEKMRETMASVILKKPRWHGVLNYENRSGAGRTMNEIGG